MAFTGSLRRILDRSPIRRDRSPLDNRQKVAVEDPYRRPNVPRTGFANAASDLAKAWTADGYEHGRVRWK